MARARDARHEGVIRGVTRRAALAAWRCAYIYVLMWPLTAVRCGPGGGSGRGLAAGNSVARGAVAAWRGVSRQLNWALARLLRAAMYEGRARGRHLRLRRS